jgi:acyl-CoA thioesterase-1
MVLHVGDSTVGTYKSGLARALGERFKEDGARYVYETWESASLVKVATSTRLRELIAKYKPDLVILTLGTNDVEVPAPWALEGSIRAIAKKVGERDCYWMGPPLWKDAGAGLVDTIRANSAPCTFFDGSGLKLERLIDGFHPSNKGGEAWADDFWAFFRGDTRHR